MDEGDIEDREAWEGRATDSRTRNMGFNRLKLPFTSGFTEDGRGSRSAAPLALSADADLGSGM